MRFFLPLPAEEPGWRAGLWLTAIGYGGKGD